MNAEQGLPSFMIIGAVKAATTWLSHQLRLHPDLWLPTAEPHFFSTEYHRGMEWYRSLFEAAPPGRHLGEKSADYLAHPDAAARIASTLPGIPLIVQLRDPVDRAYSDYCMLYRRGLVGGDPRRYLDRRRARETRFLEGGRYGYHLLRLFQYVPPAQVKVVLYEDLVADPGAVMKVICKHIGAAVHVADEALPERHNDSRAPLLPLNLRRLLRPARPILDPLRSNPWFARLRASMARPLAYPPLTDELREILRDYYREDIRMVGAMLNRDLTAWLAGDTAAGAKFAMPSGSC